MKRIALTFDDGPNLDVMPRVLDVMEKYNARCTFFCVGQNISDATDAVLERALKLGCELGNHSLTHACLTEIPTDEITREINATSALLERHAGIKCRIVRAPYGAVNDVVCKTVPYPLINWSVDTTDWDEKTAAESIINTVKEQADDGKIVLMHVIYEHTAVAVEALVPYLIGQGFELVTVPELYEAMGSTLQSGTLYPQN